MGELLGLRIGLGEVRVDYFVVGFGGPGPGVT